MELLRGEIRPYPWGSHEAIARLQGRPAPTARPEAELWFGAHPDSPSRVLRDGRWVPLTELIAADPAELLGARVVAGFGARLPFLIKLLAAEQPLSLQAHPDAGYARAAYAAERAGGGDPAGYAYTDPYHKPEMLVALTEFEALSGFRAPAEAAALLSRLRIPALAPVLATLADPDPAVALGGAVRTLLTWPAAGRAELVAAAVAGAGDEPELAVVPQTAARYPTDPGVLLTLLLNHVILAPGEALWMPAGNLHAYLRGTGVELLANSDNVLRGGFTGKPVNVPELLNVLRFEVLADPLVKPVSLGSGLTGWPVPVPDFTLYRVEPDGVTVTVPVDGPAIALAVAGEVAVDDGAGTVTLSPGTAGFARGTGKPLLVAGRGTVFVASTG
jgi:mannose-6-phosphate isomerase